MDRVRRLRFGRRDLRHRLLDLRVMPQARVIAPSQEGARGG